MLSWAANNTRKLGLQQEGGPECCECLVPRSDVWDEVAACVPALPFIIFLRRLCQ